MYRIAVCKLHSQPQTMLEQDVYEHVEKQHSEQTRNLAFPTMKEFWKRYFDFYESPMKPGDVAWIKMQHSKIDTGVGT